MSVGEAEAGRPTGARLRRIRVERGLSQADFASQVGLSASYYNQLENGHRPMSTELADRISRAAGLPGGWFDLDSERRLLAELRDAMLPYLPDSAATAGELRDLVRTAPGIAAAVITGQQRAAAAADRLAELDDPGPVESQSTIRSPHEEVRDFFHDHHNQIDVLDRGAEQLVEHWGLRPGDMQAGLARLIHAVYGVTVHTGGPDTGSRRSYDAADRTLTLSPHLDPGRRAFQIALQVGLLAETATISELVDHAENLSAPARELTRVGLAQYYAGAVLLPYTAFRRAAERDRYDIDRLASTFGVGFETICHRLSTLQRPDAAGVPFFFVRTDRAGNISKRQSASAFHFSRTGGSCPLWIVHEAFDTPGRIRRQIAEMPDGRTYLWIARTVTGRATGFRRPQPLFAVGLGCDVRHAHRLIYADGLDLTDRQAVTPIGPGCRTCERTDCVQRAFPLIGRPLRADPDLSPEIPYW